MKKTIENSEPAAISKCQIFDISNTSVQHGWVPVLRHIADRLRRFLKRRYRYASNLISELNVRGLDSIEKTNMGAAKKDFQSGDCVRVRPRNEIKKELDRWNQLKKCSFMEEMWPYCGTTHRILKKVDKFLDERDYSLKKCNGLYILDGVMCNGTVDFGDCDRSCFYFWREEWLEKVEETGQQCNEGNRL